MTRAARSRKAAVSGGVEDRMERLDAFGIMVPRMLIYCMSYTLTSRSTLLFLSPWTPASGARAE